MESATTNLSEATADFVRLWDGAALAHREVREIFLNKQAVVSPQTVQVGQEVDTELLYPEPTDEQVPSLKGLLQYIDTRGGGSISKTYHMKRQHFTLNEGPVQQVQQHKTRNTHRHEQISVTDHHSYNKTVKRTSIVLLEVFAPVMLVKQIRNVRVTRPMYIFAS